MDIKRPDYEPTAAHEFLLVNLRKFDNCLQACIAIDQVYGLAANMGGIGFISRHQAAAHGVRPNKQEYRDFLWELLTKSWSPVQATLLVARFVSHLLAQGHQNLRGVDIKPCDQWYQHSADVEILSLDLDFAVAG